MELWCWAETLSRSCLPHLVVIISLSQVSAAGLSDSLPWHQISHHHRGGTDLCHTQTQSAHQQLQLPTRLPPKNPERTLTHLAVSAAVWAGWWHRCGGTSGHCRGAAPPPGTAAWSPTGGCRPEESWEGCWPAPEPDRRRPPRGCCLWPESHEGVWSDCRWDLTSPWGNSLCWE